MRPPRPPLALLSLLFALSGAAGLVQEVAWNRALAQSLGHSLQALTAVLVCFLGGLGLGAAAGARLAGRVGPPLRLYAGLEAAVAIGALAAPRVAALFSQILERFGPAVETAAGLAVLRFVLALAALLPPTLAMGATLPCLVREATRRGADPTGAVATLYGWNTLGAAAGAACGSFLLLPLLGTRLTFGAAAAMNLAAALGALVLAAALPPPAAGAAPGRDGAPTAAAGALPGDRRRAALIAVLVSGCAGALLQVGWIRVATLAFGSTVFAVGATLTAYIAGLGAGPLLARRAIGRAADPVLPAAATLAVAGVASLLILPLLGLLPEAAAALAAFLPGGAPLLLLGLPFALLFLVLLPATAAQGASFPALVATAGAGAGVHRDAGVLYGASTAGSVAGFLLAGFVLLPSVGSRRTLAIAGLASLAVAAALLRLAVPAAPAGRRLRRRLCALLLAVSVAGVATASRTWTREVVSGGGLLYGPVYRAAGGPRPAEAMRRRGAILYYREDGSGIVTVRRNPAGVLSLQINGKTEASTGGDVPTQLLAGHLPLLLHPHPGRVLVIGLASGITVGAAERHPIETVTVFEIARGVIDAARLFDDHHQRALDDPRLDLRVDDARGGLLVRRDRYDVIASQPSNPWVAGVANLFTEEFYRLARSRLAPGGLICQWVQAYRLAPDDLKGIVAAFLRVFPEATLWEESPGGGDYFLIGGDAPLRIDPARLAAAGREAAWADLKRAGLDGPADLLARFVSGPAGLARLASGARAHGDDRLTLETRAPLALFRDDPRAAIEMIDAHREPVFGLLADGAALDPGLARDLAARLRARRERMSILAGLRDADLWALTDPFLAAGADALRRDAPLEALPALQRAAADNPRSAAAQLLLAAAYRSSGLERAARVALQAALGIDPGLAPAWNLLGRALADVGRSAEARRAFEEAARHAREPGLGAAARNNLGALLVEAGDTAGAERLFREALALDPFLAAAHANLGLVLKRRGDAPGAEAAYGRSLALEPMNADARYNLAMLLASGGRRAAAAAELETLLAFDPDDAGAAAALRELRSGR
jgi:spermidine synthase/tetratricopeptide (TPR) repeat protein